MISKKLIIDSGDDVIDRSGRPLARLIAFLSLLLTTSPAWGVTTIIPSTQPATNGLSCVGTRNAGAMVCAAKEFTVGTSFSAAPGTPPFCIAGTPFSFQVELALSGSNADRYDMAFYTGETGNDPQINDATKLCSVATFPITPLPYADFDGNSCGDYAAAGDSIITVNEIKAVCQGDSAGSLTIPYTLTYFPTSSGACTGPLDVLVPPTSKCQAAIASVNGTVSVFSGAYVDVTKQTSPDGDSQPFSFTATGPAGSKVIALTGAALTTTGTTGGTYTPATIALATNTTTVTLTDGQTARFYINALAADQRLTITETDTANWETAADIICGTSQAPLPPLLPQPSFVSVNNATRVITADLNTTNKAAACTVTNTKRATVAKFFSPATIVQGGTSDLTFTIDNYAATAKPFTLTDNTASGWPTGMTVVNTIPKNSNCGGTLRNSTNDADLTTANSGSGFYLLTNDIAANSSCTLVLTVSVPTPGFYYNTAAGLVYAGGGPGPNSNTATLQAINNVTLSKAFAAASLASGGNTNLTVTIGNSGASAYVLSSPLTDSFPAGMTIGTAGSSGTCPAGSVTAAAGANSFTVATGTSIPPGGCTVVVNVTSSTAGAATNTIAIGALQTTAGFNTVPTSSTLNIYAPPTIAKAFGASTIGVNASTALNLTVTNPNANAALSGIAFTDTLPAGLTAVNGTSSTCGGSLVITGGNLLTFTGGTLAGGGNCVISTTITGTTAGVKSNTTSAVTATSPIALSGATSNTSTVTVFTPPTIAKLFSPAAILTGATSTITFTLTNPNSTAMTGASFTDTFPGVMKTIAAAQTYTGAGRGTCTGASPASNTGANSSVSFAGINIPANGSCTVLVDVSAASAGTYINNVSGVTTSETQSAGPGSTSTLTVLAAPIITKSFSPSTITSGANSTLTLTISNPNASAISLTSLFTDTFLSGVTIGTAGNSGTCTGVTATAGANNFTIANGTSIPAGGCTVIVNVTSTTTQTNTIAAGALQTTAGNNAAAASDTLTVVPAASNRLAYTKTFSQSQVQTPASLNMIFTISNLSAAVAAEDVVFSTDDTMPIAGGSRMTLADKDNPCTITSATPAGSCAYNGTSALGTIVPNSVNSSTILNFKTFGTGLGLAANSNCTLTCPVNISTLSTGGTYTNSAAFLNTGTAGFTTTTGDSASVIALKAPTISKTFSPGIIGAGSSSTMTFTLLNNAADTVAYSNATFTDTLANISISGNQTAGGSCSGAAGNSFTDGQTGLITLSGLTIPAGAFGCTVTLLVTSTTVGTNNNTTSGVTTTQTPAAGSASNTIGLFVRGTTLTKAFAPTAIMTGVPARLTFTITNGAGNPAQTGLAFTETLPANMLVASPANASTTCGSATVTAGEGSGTIALSGGSMTLNQATCTVAVNVTSNSAGTYSNVAANVTGTSPGMTKSVNATLTVSDHPTLTKTFTPATIGLNGTSSLAFTIANSIGNPAQSALGFTDTLPSGLVISTPNGLVTDCVGTVTATAGTSAIAYSGGTIAGGTAGCTITVNTTSATAGSYSNTSAGNITGLAGGLTANALSSALSVVGTTLSKSFLPTTQMLGSNSQLALTISNGAGNPAQSGLAFTDTLPAGLLVSSPSGLVNGCGGAVTAAAGSNTITLAAGTLAATAPSCTITVNTIAAAVGTYTNDAARISGTSSNIDAGGASASVSYLARAGINKLFSPNTITTDATSTIIFSLTNANSITLTNATFTDTLGGMAISANQSAGGTCGGAAGNSFTLGQTGLLTFSSLSIPPGGCTVTVAVTSDTPGAHNNTTSGVTTTQTTVGAVSNTAQLTVTAAVPTIAKAFAPATIVQGTTSTITFTLGNTNGINLTAAGFTDTLTNMAISGAQTAGGSCAGVGSNSFVNGQTSLTFTGLTIPANGSCTVTVIITGNSAGTLPNQTSGVSSSQAATGLVSNIANLNVYTPPTIIKAFIPATVDIYEPSTMTFTLSNPNNGAMTAANFTDTLTGFSVASPPDIGGTCAGVTNSPVLAAGATSLNLTVPNLAAAGSCTITIPVSASSAGSYSNTTSGITTSETGAAVGTPSNTANLAVVFLPLQVTKSASVMTASPGTPVTYDISYGNPNATTKLQSIVITDPVPLYTTYESASCSLPLPETITSCDIVFTAPPAGVGNGIVTWTLGGTLDAGKSGIVQLTVRIQ